MASAVGRRAHEYVLGSPLVANALPGPTSAAAVSGETLPRFAGCPRYGSPEAVSGSTRHVQPIRLLAWNGGSSRPLTTIEFLPRLSRSFPRSSSRLVVVVLSWIEGVAGRRPVDERLVYQRAAESSTRSASPQRTADDDRRGLVGRLSDPPARRPRRRWSRFSESAGRIGAVIIAHRDRCLNAPVRPPGARHWAL